MIEIAHAEALGQQSLHVYVDLGFRYIAAAYGLGDVFVHRATLHIGTPSCRKSRRCRRIFRYLVPLGQIEVADGAAVGHYKAVVIPFVAEYLLE